MELELQKESFEHYQKGATVADFHEERAETIVPDYSPDIRRIVDVSACLFRRSMELTDGRLTVTGTVKLTLLFLAEGETRLRALDYSIPFEHTPEARFPEDAIISAEGRLCGAEAQLLNPRKLSTRLDIDWRLTPYRKATLTLSSGVTEGNRYAVQTLNEQQDISLIESVAVRDFSFADELTLPGGREETPELLSAAVNHRVTECRSIGSKVVLKGVACLRLLYAAEGNRILSHAEELPFSQILDGGPEGSGELGVSAALSLIGCEIHTAEGGAVRAVLQFSAFVVLRRSISVSCVTDLYSTLWELKAEAETVELHRPPKISVVSQSVREQLETGTEVKSVLSADVCFGSVTARQEGGKTMLRSAVAPKVLYLDESGAPLSAQRRIEVTAEAAVNGEATASVENICAGDITASVNAEGVELRFPVNFTLVEQTTVSCPSLLSLSAEESDAAEKVPSLVLRALNEGERLWDLAKQYRTTVEEILSANELADEAAAELGRLLLIPRKR